MLVASCCSMRRPVFVSFQTVPATNARVKSYQLVKSHIAPGKGSILVSPRFSIVFFNCFGAAHLEKNHFLYCNDFRCLYYRIDVSFACCLPAAASCCLLLCSCCAMGMLCPG